MSYGYSRLPDSVDGSHSTVIMLTKRSLARIDIVGVHRLLRFFLTFRRTSHLDGRHTVFRRVVEGQNVLSALQQRNPQETGQPNPDRFVKAEVLRKRDHRDKPTKVE